MRNNLKSIIGISFLLIILFNQSQYTTAFHTYLCIRLPKGSFPDSTYDHSGAKDVASVGMDKFPQNIWKKYFFALNSDGDDTGFLRPELHYRFQSTGETPVFILGVHPIRGRLVDTLEPLTGWYQIQITLSIGSGRFDEIVKSFLLLATDEQHNPIGEFLTSAQMPGAEGATCDLNDATNYMVIPCGGASKYEPTVSNVIVWASRKINTFNKVSGEHGDIVPEYEKKVLSFYFRFSIQDANRSAQKYIIFRFVADLNEDYDWIGRDQVQLNPNEKHKTLFSAAAWLKLKKGHVPGATDPLLTDVIARDCNENLETNEPHVPNTQQWFIQRFSNDINRDLRETQLGYRQHWFYFIHKYAGCTAKFFGGRCSYTKCDVTHTPSERRPVASLGQIPSWHSAATIKCPGCPQIVAPWECVDEFADPPKKINNNETVFPDCLEGYNMTMIRSGCVSNITKEGALAANITSIRRPRGNHTTIIGDGLKINISSDQNKINTRGIRGVGFGTMLYSIRKGHGVLMVVVSMFFVPVICFTSRYFKETFMNSRILLARVWLQLHVQSVFWIVAFYFGGMLLAFAGRALLGVSLQLAGIAHRVLGWVTLAVFIIIAATGPFRLIDDPGRRWTIGIHWVLGYVFYLLNIATIITSVHIPGSPISDHDESIIHDRDEFTVYKAYVILGLWLIIELVLGVIMTIHIHTHDHSMQVEGPRKYFPPFIGAAIPVLRENSHVDAAGFTCRHLIFWIYIGLALLAAIGMSGAIIVNKMTPYKGYGPMWCTHNSTLALLPEIKPECRYY